MDTNGNGKVLIVDDEPNAIRVLSAILSKEGYNVFESFNVEKALQVMDTMDVDAVITDVKMPDKDGMQFFEHINEHYPDIPVIFLTAFGTVDSAVHTMTRGAFYYFIKPPDYVKLKGILKMAVEKRHLKREIESLRERLARSGGNMRLIGANPEMLKILDTIAAVKDSTSNVLICGATGTGKELIAKTLHYDSIRRDRPFVAVNCAAIPKELIESELFGYEKGAFTGAFSGKPGKFEEASDGTLFLDEIGELDLSLQAKLLRILQEREIERLGSNKKIKVEFRLLSSTNRDLKKEIQTGNFRKDLFYRIDVVQLNVPSLRDRKEDVPLFIAEFIKEFSAREKKIVKVSDEVMNILQNYSWPGNVRQLRNVIERAVVLAAKDKITLKDLPDDFLLQAKLSVSAGKIKTLREIELHAVKEALKECKGNKSKAAKMLGISRKTFYQRLNRLH
ncbi:MAG: sigma-54-dependent Fis family transcriptional regulator [Nitrospirae bacterium]|nr:sigma-54-dependent Fis family transcriptional regulator [Nitrospirota bacterium]